MHLPPSLPDRLPVGEFLHRSDGTEDQGHDDAEIRDDRERGWGRWEQDANNDGKELVEQENELSECGHEFCW